MSEFRKGDKVLVEAEFDRVGRGANWCDDVLVKRETVMSFGRDRIHRHPGVPVADLLKELELAALITDDMRGLGPYQHAGTHKAYFQLRKAREAAQKPKLKDGQKVWVRATVEMRETERLAASCGDNVLVCLPNGLEASLVHPDDIRTEEP